MTTSDQGCGSCVVHTLAGIQCLVLVNMGKEYI